jgi:hypothetical protein
MIVNITIAYIIFLVCADEVLSKRADTIKGTVGELGQSERILISFGNTTKEGENL